MLEKLAKMEENFEAMSQQLYDPEIVSDNKRYSSLMKEYKNLEPVIEKYRELKQAKNELEQAQELMYNSSDDPEMHDLAEEEFESSREKTEALTEELKILLLPKDPDDDKDVIIEIRGGAGGEEAALFANSLFRMYSMYAESKKWKLEILNANQTELGGFKEISFSVEGEGAYSRFKYESGVHRVQRVPETESQGRIQTSTATVAVLIEPDEVEVEINPADIKTDVFRSSGAGGQHINKTESAVRLTHLPTGIVVECQDERSQHKNKDRAMKILRSKLYDIMQSQRDAEIAKERKGQVGSGDRSEKIRTYNFPQCRMTDHRINLTLYKLEDVMNGKLDEIIDALATADQAAKLAGQEE